MPRRRKVVATDEDIRGLKYFRAFEDVLAPLRGLAVHGNRKFLYEHYVSLLLLHFFNPLLDSLRALQKASDLASVQATLGIKHVSLGSISESASRVFDPELLLPVIRELSCRGQQLVKDGRLKDLPMEIRACDGSFLRCLPRMVWALFRRKSQHRAVRMHLIYDVVRGLPAELEITDARYSEKKVLRRHITPAVLYLIDRGYIDYGLYQAIHDAGAFFVARLKDNSTCQVLEARPLTGAEKAAGVVSDEWVQVGSNFTKGKLTAAVRRVTVANAEGKRLVVLTNSDLPAETIALLYRFRWQIELFFRWFKCILGCTHLLSLSERGLTIQVYVAIIASMLIALWTGRKPTKWTFQMICLYFQGWANWEELTAHIESLKKQA